MVLKAICAMGICAMRVSCAEVTPQHFDCMQLIKAAEDDSMTPVRQVGQV